MAAAIGVAAPASVLSQELATAAAVVRPAASGAAKGLGRLSALLTRNTLALENVIQVDLSADINCAVIGYTAPGTGGDGRPGCYVPGSRFPPM